MSVDTARPGLRGFDPFAREFLLEPPKTWHRAQREAPVFYHPELKYWVLTKYDDVQQALVDWQTFSSAALDVIPPPDDIAPDLPENFFEPSLVANDPPSHTATRKAINPAFTRPKVAAMEPAIADIANGLIDRFIDRGNCDFMGEFCFPLSLQTIVHMFGLPNGEKDMEDYRRWTEGLFSMLIPKSPEGAEGHPMPAEEVRAHWENIREAVRVCTGLLEERRAEPRDDLLTAMVEARREDGTLVMNDGEIILHIIEIIAAGNDTTANLLGSFLVYMSRQPADFRRLKSNPELLDNAIEEVLRRRGSSNGMFRLTTRDVTMSGVEIPKGELVFVSFQAAGNDESHFPNSLFVDIERQNADEHLSFGKGRHFCMGSPLARLESRIALSILFERIPDIEAVPDQQLDYVPAMTASMLPSLKARWSVGGDLTADDRQEG